MYVYLVAFYSWLCAVPPKVLVPQPSVFFFQMGAEYFCYASDVTCSFPVSGKFSEKYKPIYTAVLDAQTAVYEILRPGVSWVVCHKTAEAVIIKALVKLGLVEPRDKTVEELVEMRLGAVFMPHGLGHFIGIDTHDVLNVQLGFHTGVVGLVGTNHASRCA